jgi:hypothetical protein
LSGGQPQSSPAVNPANKLGQNNNSNQLLTPQQRLQQQQQQQQSQNRTPNANQPNSQSNKTPLANNQQKPGLNQASNNNAAVLQQQRNNNNTPVNVKSKRKILFLSIIFSEKKHILGIVTYFRLLKAQNFAFSSSLMRKISKLGSLFKLIW